MKTIEELLLEIEELKAQRTKLFLENNWKQKFWAYKTVFWTLDPNIYSNFNMKTIKKKFKKAANCSEFEFNTIYQTFYGWNYSCGTQPCFEFNQFKIVVNIDLQITILYRKLKNIKKQIK